MQKSMPYVLSALSLPLPQTHMYACMHRHFPTLPTNFHTYIQFCFSLHFPLFKPHSSFSLSIFYESRMNTLPALGLFLKREASKNRWLDCVTPWQPSIASGAIAYIHLESNNQLMCVGQPTSRNGKEASEAVLKLPYYFGQLQCTRF